MNIISQEQLDIEVWFKFYLLSKELWEKTSWFYMSSEPRTGGNIYRYYLVILARSSVIKVEIDGKTF